MGSAGGFFGQNNSLNLRWKSRNYDRFCIFLKMVQKEQVGVFGSENHQNKAIYSIPGIEVSIEVVLPIGAIICHQAHLLPEEIAGLYVWPSTKSMRYCDHAIEQLWSCHANFVLHSIAEPRSGNFAIMFFCETGTATSLVLWTLKIAFSFAINSSLEIRLHK